MSQPLLSVVISVYNEEENIPTLSDELNRALSQIDYEIIWVDDGSSDRSIEVLRNLKEGRNIIVELARNFGQSSAMRAGIDRADGKYIATMDGDLQNDPADLPGMLELAIEEKWDVVAGYRKDRKDKGLTRKIPSSIANRIIRNLTKAYLSDYGCSLRIYNSKIAKNLDLYGELHRFIPVLAALQGARMTEVAVNHRARVAGVSKYGLGRTSKVVVDLLLILFYQRFLQRPMHLFGGIGLLFFGLGMLINLYLLIEKFSGADIWGRPLLLLGVVLILGGIQFITIGIVVDLLIRTYFESQNKATYVIREVYQSGFTESGANV